MSYYPIAALQIDRPRPAAGVESISYLQRFFPSVRVMNDDALEFDRSAVNLYLQRPESPVITADVDAIVI